MFSLDTITPWTASISNKSPCWIVNTKLMGTLSNLNLNILSKFKGLFHHQHYLKFYIPILNNNNNIYTMLWHMGYYDEILTLTLQLYTKYQWTCYNNSLGKINVHDQVSAVHRCMCSSLATASTGSLACHDRSLAIGRSYEIGTFIKREEKWHSYL